VRGCVVTVLCCGLVNISLFANDFVLPPEQYTGQTPTITATTTATSTNTPPTANASDSFLDAGPLSIPSSTPNGKKSFTTNLSINRVTTSLPCTTTICGVSVGQFVSGTILVQPNLTLNPDIRKVAYYLNGTQSGKVYSAPFTWGGATGFDTTQLQDGAYTLGGAYTTGTGDKAFSIVFTVNNSVSTSDTTPPLISSVNSTNVTSSGGSINWTTNEASDSHVEYRAQGLTNWLATSLNTALVTNHSVVLTGLTADTNYEYRVKSKDSAGNLAAQSTISNFKTSKTTLITPEGRTLGGLQFPLTTSFVDADQLGNLALLADATSLYIVNNANPASPQLISTVGFKGPIIDILAPTGSKSVFVMEFVGPNTGYTGSFDYRFWVLNLADPSNPTLEVKAVLADAQRLNFFNNTVYFFGWTSARGDNRYVVSCSPDGSSCQGSFAGYYAGTDLVYEYGSRTVWADVGSSAIGNDYQDGTYTSTAAPVAFFSSKDNDLFVSLKNGSVAVYDINQTDTRPYDPATGQQGTGQIPVVQTIDTQGNDPIFNLIYGNRLAVLDSTGLIEIFDITNPLNPTRVDSTTVAGARRIDFNGNNLYAVTGNQYLIIGPASPTDTIPPVISADSATNVNSSGATITWMTNEAADSQVEYRPQGSTVWLATGVNTSLVTNHSVALTGLNADTTYEYRVKSKDPAGNLATQTNFSIFKTGALSATCTTAICGVTSGQTVNGMISVKPNLTFHPTIRKVFYYLNGTQSGKYYAAPFTWGGTNGFDTKTLANNTYTLSGAYTDSTGDHNFSIQFTVRNPS